MRISGNLITKSKAPASLFDNYLVIISYTEIANKAERCLREKTQQQTLFNGSSTFAFNLPEIDLPRGVQIEVFNALGASMSKTSYPYEKIQNKEVVELSIPINLSAKDISRSGPLLLTGKLDIDLDKDATLDGYKITAGFSAYKRNKEDSNTLSLVSDLVSLPLENRNKGFELMLPSTETLNPNEKVRINVIYPDGTVPFEKEYGLNELRKKISISLNPFPSRVIQKTPTSTPGQDKKIKGKVIDTNGKILVSNKQVIIWARRGKADFQSIFTAITDKQGNFSGPYIYKAFDEAKATVADTKESNLDTGVNIELHELAKDETFIPEFIYIPVNFPEENSLTPNEETKDDCDCHTPKIPRNPDEHDLTYNSEVYSQDIGGACVNLTTPNRTLEEFDFYSVVRTTDPEITGDLPLEERQVLSTPGRRKLSSKAPIDWDSTPTFYQATEIAHGHILHFKTTWKADGYSMGDLLYSLPLAPGQKKQIAVFDWDRSESSQRTEDVNYGDALNAFLTRSRDINEIMNGAFNESLRGSSSSDTKGFSYGQGSAASGAVNILSFGIASGFSGSWGSANSSASQDSGRDLAASMLNNLRDSIFQGASSVRNQRTTVVQTVNQNERFRVQTEVVVNHNHCHALTIEYFEILRHYLVEQRIVDVQECLYIPLLIYPFTFSKVLRWRDILQPAIPRVPFKGQFYSLASHPLYRGFDAIARITSAYVGSNLPLTTYADEMVRDISGDFYVTFYLNRPRDNEDGSADKSAYDKLKDFGARVEDKINKVLNWFDLGPTEEKKPALTAEQKDQIFDENIAPEIVRSIVNKFQFFAYYQGGLIPLNLDVSLVSNYSKGNKLMLSITGPCNIQRNKIERFIIMNNGAELLQQSINSYILFNGGTLKYSTEHYEGYLFKNYTLNNDLMPSDGVSIFTPLSQEELTNPREEDKKLAKDLVSHLNDNLELYHKLLWYRMDADRRYMLLDGIVAPNANGRSVASVVENRLIGIVGNSLVMPVARGFQLDPIFKNDNRNQKVSILLDHYQPNTPISPSRISVPTRGIFAEAIQGACNACEKKEENRFWRWQEEPITDEPTLIQPINTDTRRTEPGNLQAKDFPQTIINMQSPPAAPDPTSLSTLFDLLGKPNIFKDITGLDQTQKNALLAMLSTQESAKEFAKMATQLAMNASANKNADTTLDKIQQSKDKNLISGDKSKELTENVLKSLVSSPTDSNNVDNQLAAIEKAFKSGLIDEEQKKDFGGKLISKLIDSTGDNTLTKDDTVKDILKNASLMDKDISISTPSSGSVIVTGSPGSVSDKLKIYQQKQLFNSIIEITQNEWTRWGTQIQDLVKLNGIDRTSYDATKVESQTDWAKTILNNYWHVGTGNAFAPDSFPNDAALVTWIADPNHPWSATFISYVMRKAGIVKPNFNFPVRHGDYIKAAINRETDFMFWAHELAVGVPEVGDIVCFSELSNAFEHFRNDNTGHSHGDIVVNVNSTKGFIEVIGGNVHEAVTKKIIKINSDGTIARAKVYSNKTFKWFAILKNRLTVDPIIKNYDSESANEFFA